VTSYSNTASFLGVLAPSNRAYTTDIAGSSGYSSGDFYSDFGGTSAACPYAAGAAACIQSAAIQIFGSALSPAEIRDLLTGTGDAVTDGKVAITKPRINLGSAIGTLQPSPPTAQDVAVSTPVSTAVTIPLDAEDDGLPNPPGMLSYTIVSLPNHGTLSDPQGGAISIVPYNLGNYGSQVIYTPRPGCGAGTTFLYAASDGGAAPQGGLSNIATVTITFSAVQTIYSADMNSNPGWSPEGQWQWGVPLGQGGGGGRGNHDPTGGFTGSAVLGYNLAGDYANNIAATQWVTTPAIDCSTFETVTLSFYRWLNVDAPDNDQAFVQISNDQLNWTIVWQNSVRVTDAAWTLQTFDVSTVAGHQPNVYLRWGLGPTNNNQAYSGWNIDDVLLTGTGDMAAPTPGDFEPDCDVDLDDLMYLVQYWLQSCGTCAADLTADSTVNLEDAAILAQHWLTQP
jgi:hypothetical protein